MTHISAVSSRSFFRRALDWANESSEEPLRLLRMAIGGLLLFGTIVAVVLAITGIEPRALALAGIFWALYGFLIGLTNGVLEPLVDGFFSLLANFGLERVRGYSEVETLMARGQLAEAAEAYRLRAQAPADRTEPPCDARRCSPVRWTSRRPPPWSCRRSGCIRSPRRKISGWGWRWRICTIAAWAIPAARWASCGA
jgi:hypothetical protein